MTQLEFTALIPHVVEGEIIQQRVKDGYINATAMCKIAGKKINDYNRLSNTKEFIEELSTVTGIPVTELIFTKQRGKLEEIGTWVHPNIAIHLGQWLSPKFAVRVTQWVHEWMSGKIPQKLPYHIERYLANRSEIPPTHFSMLNEMTFGLIAPLEETGYTLPEGLLPDISEGKMFSRWLRDEKGLDTKAMPTYTHRFQDGRVVQARLYPNTVLADFRKHFNEVWLPQRAISYFGEKDPKALEHLPKVFALPNPKRKLLKQ